MVRTRQIVTVMWVLVTTQLCTACVTVYEVESFCLENGDFSMTCPQDHKLIIKKALHKVVKTGPCLSDLSSVDICTLSDLTKDVSKTCHTKNNCTVSVSDSSTACSGYTGNKFITVTYKCEPEFVKSSKATSTPFCSEISWEGSLAYLNNLDTPDGATRCVCTVTVPQNVNVDVKRLYIDGNCADFVNMVDKEDQPTDFCQAGELHCKDGGRQLHFEYIPKGQTLVFISISVSYKASFNLQCNINPVPSTTVPTTRPTTQTTTVATTTTPTTTSTTTTTTTPTTTNTTLTTTAICHYMPTATTTTPMTATTTTTVTTKPIASTLTSSTNTSTTTLTTATTTTTIISTMPTATPTTPMTATTTTKTTSTNTPIVPTARTTPTTASTTTQQTYINSHGTNTELVTGQTVGLVVTIVVVIIVVLVAFRLYFRTRKLKKDAENLTAAIAAAAAAATAERQAANQVHTRNQESHSYIDFVMLDNPYISPHDSEHHDGVKYGPYCTIGL